VLEHEMKVVFLQDVEGVARVGDVKTVKDGYARNFLMPRGIALPPTKDVLSRATALAEKEERRQRKLDDEARKVLAKFEGRTVTILARVGEQGRLYGSVTNGDIADELSKLAGTEVDRHLINLPDPIRETGTHEVAVRMTRNVSTTVTVQVVPEGSEEAEEIETGPVVVQAISKGKKKAQEAVEEPPAEDEQLADEAEEAEAAEDDETEV
jgi:large subunit ribosomal protein L9